MDDRLASRGLTRGGLIKAGAIAALAVGSGGAGAALAGGAGIGLGAAGSGIGKPGRGPAYLTHATYVPLIATEFRVHRPGAGPLRVTLIEARRLPSVGEAFSLHFRGHPRASLKSGMHRLAHPLLGEFDLFLGPVGRGVKGLELEAVINRIAT